ncbi:MAG: ribosome biogenesis GTPase YlqF [Candidatus Gastranaerophilales bacterium]|nr:ribosome biogenesis GTPase YlqF [Candidatus Gastranaerophilales bacterium]
MTINWYPGHIAKAERELKEKLSLVDVVVEIIDARMPVSSKYVGIEKLIGSKPHVIVMNKSDLADLTESKKWKTFFGKNARILLSSANSNKDISSIISAVIDAGKETIAKLTAKGLLPRPVRVMIVGLPNVGKSSIINKLIGKKKAKTGAKAGITRQQQWVRINPRVELLDTPGIIPMKLENQDAAYKLAMANSVGEATYDVVEVAKVLISLLSDKYPQITMNYYNIERQEDLTLENIAKARNLLVLGGEVDINRCAALVLSDFRHGKIGKITLDTLYEND